MNEDLGIIIEQIESLLMLSKKGQQASDPGPSKEYLLKLIKMQNELLERIFIRIEQLENEKKP